MLIIVIRTLILYTTVIISLRVMGKRQLGELQPSELVVAIMISDLASVPMQDIDIPLLWGILPVLTLIVAEVLLSYWSLKSEKARKLLSGTPNIVIYNGKIIEGELKKLRFNMNDLLSELRLNDCHDVSEVAAAVVETSGKLSIIKKTGANNVTVDDFSGKQPKKEGLPCVLISDGVLSEEELNRSGYSKQWLEKYLKRQKADNIKDIFLMSINPDGEIFIQKREQK